MSDRSELLDVSVVRRGTDTRQIAPTAAAAAFVPFRFHLALIPPNRGTSNSGGLVPVPIDCPSCQGRLLIPDALWQQHFAARVQRMTCKKCGQVVGIDGRNSSPVA